VVSRRGLRQIGRARQGIGDGAEIIRQWPKSAEGYDARGTTFLNGGEYALAVPEYEKAVAISPKSALLRARLGMAYFGAQEKTPAARVWMWHSLLIHITSRHSWGTEC